MTKNTTAIVFLLFATASNCSLLSTTVIRRLELFHGHQFLVERNMHTNKIIQIKSACNCHSANQLSLPQKPLPRSPAYNSVPLLSQYSPENPESPGRAHMAMPERMEEKNSH